MKSGISIKQKGLPTNKKHQSLKEHLRKNKVVKAVEYSFYVMVSMHRAQIYVQVLRSSFVAPPPPPLEAAIIITRLRLPKAFLKVGDGGDIIEGVVLVDFIGDLEKPLTNAM
jgi:hypothetical protein